jgi:hypothetical protein
LKQLLESQAATWKPEQASWRGLMEVFLELVSDLIATSKNFILIFSTKGQLNIVKTISGNKTALIWFLGLNSCHYLFKNSYKSI